LSSSELHHRLHALRSSESGFDETENHVSFGNFFFGGVPFPAGPLCTYTPLAPSLSLLPSVLRPCILVHTACLALALTSCFLHPDTCYAQLALTSSNAAVSPICSQSAIFRRKKGVANERNAHRDRPKRKKHHFSN
jgi:hypothetical protein